MIIHIVRANENLSSILEHYHVDRRDIVGENKHITDFNHLKPGMKIKIPVITPEIIEVLEETEPFIEEYYSQNNDVINVDETPLVQEEERVSEEVEERTPNKVKKTYPKYGFHKI